MSLMHDWQVIGTAKMVSKDGTVIVKNADCKIDLNRVLNEMSSCEHATSPSCSL